MKLSMSATVVGLFLLMVPIRASALVITVTAPPYNVPDTTDVGGYIGIARPPGGTLRPYMCLHTATSETAILLNTSAVSTLTETVQLGFNNADNRVYFNRSGGVPPTAAQDCGLVDWAPLNFNGFLVSVLLQSTRTPTGNNITTNAGSGSVLIAGGFGNDRAYLYGPVATVTMHGAADDVTSVVGHSSGGIITGAGNDCIDMVDSDVNGAALASCQSGTEDRGSPFGAIPLCELGVIGSCGLI